MPADPVSESKLSQTGRVSRVNQVVEGSNLADVTSLSASRTGTLTHDTAQEGLGSNKPAFDETASDDTASDETASDESESEAIDMIWDHDFQLPSEQSPHANVVKNRFASPPLAGRLSHSNGVSQGTSQTLSPSTSGSRALGRRHTSYMKAGSPLLLQRVQS